MVEGPLVVGDIAVGQALVEDTRVAALVVGSLPEGNNPVAELAAEGSPAVAGSREGLAGNRLAVRNLAAAAFAVGTAFVPEFRQTQRGPKNE